MSGQRLVTLSVMAQTAVAEQEIARLLKEAEKHGASVVHDSVEWPSLNDIAESAEATERVRRVVAPAPWRNGS